MGTLPSPTIAFNPQPPQDPLERYGKVAQLANLLRTGQEQDQDIQGKKLQNQVAQRQINNADALTKAFSGLGPDSDFDTAAQSLPKLVIQNGGDANTGLAASKSLADFQKDWATYAKDKQANIAEWHNQATDILSGLEDVPPDQLPAAAAKAKASILAIPGGDAPSVDQIKNTPTENLTPEGVKTLIAANGLKSRLIENDLKKQQTSEALARAQGTTTETVQKNLSNMGQVLSGATNQATWTAGRQALAAQGVPDSVLKLLSDTYSPEEAARAKQLALSPEKLAGLSAEKLTYDDWAARPENKGHNTWADFQEWYKTILPTFQIVQGNNLLSDDAKDMAADLYFYSAQVPRIYGPSGGVVQADIMKRAAARHKGESLAANSAAYAANKISLDKAVPQRDAYTAFENTGLANLNRFIDTAKGIIDTGSPWLNQPLRDVALNALGSKEQAAANAARQVALVEIARVVNNPTLVGALGEGAREEVLALNPANATLKDIYSVAQQLHADAETRGGYFDTLIGDIRTRLGGNQAVAPNTPPALTDVRPPLQQLLPQEKKKDKRPPLSDLIK